MKIALGSDHRGDETLKSLVPTLRGQGHEVILVGPCDGTSRDYPEEAWLVAQAVASGRAERGILVCGSGIGVSIAANKVHGVRAALAYDEYAAEICRKHNDANVLCLSGDGMSSVQVHRAVAAFLNSEFEGGRHLRRVDKIRAIERGEDPTKLAT